MWVDGRSWTARWTARVQLGKLPAPLPSRFPGLDAAPEGVIAGHFAVRTAQRLGFFFLGISELPRNTRPRVFLIDNKSPQPVVDPQLSNPPFLHPLRGNDTSDQPPRQCPNANPSPSSSSASATFVGLLWLREFSRALRTSPHTKDLSRRSIAAAQVHTMLERDQTTEPWRRWKSTASQTTSTGRAR